MTWGQAFRATGRSAAFFAVAYFVLTALLDLWLVGAVDWAEQAVSTVIVVPIYWAVIAWMARRRAGPGPGGEGR
ncbi:hypothetical protein [Wenxinia saemankumensis]|uniref:Uncharacterized protein n=1 Tax=Wenxinia saemankumensis TaxID=1447782 RepID=A0A1M6H397_9RHOB|nr:hypothetical protein [Wenxinia saemankumensis]SHJ16654.1 hypothetical protein SAMN05444417_3081 [Wenxinia saemankumensis]